jgi:ligand-binding SRPBCC domain-containing protein
MSLHTLNRVTVLHVSIEEAWNFFTSPYNLKEITPAKMNFRILSDIKPSDKIYKGMLIDYKVSPLFSIPMKWTTKIVEAEALHFFADEQLKGPYAYWRHEHHFKEIPEGVEMTDVVKWRVLFGILGDIVNTLLVKKEVESIFDFRKKKLKDLFPSRTLD